jgi:hypothetical protein
MRCGEWDRWEEGEHLGEHRERRKHSLHKDKRRKLKVNRYGDGNF